MGLKYEKFDSDKNGWTVWVKPIQTGYRLACCDCGLVHDMNFAITDDGKAAFQARRNDRSTAMMRRHKKPVWGKTFLQFVRRSLVAVYMQPPPHSISVRKKFIRNLAKDLGLHVRFD